MEDSQAEIQQLLNYDRKKGGETFFGKKLEDLMNPYPAQKERLDQVNPLTIKIEDIVKLD